MDFVRAIVTIRGTAPLSHSHGHDEPRLEGEGPDAYDKRTWRSKLNTDTVDGNPTVVIPAFGMQCGLAAAAKYSKRQIPGQGKATWTAKFTSGVTVIPPLALNIDPAQVDAVAVSVNADGVRGSGKRVTRRFPTIAPGWKCTFEALILDPIITQEIFTEMMELAGLFIGTGQFRPEKGGTNGRFIVEKVEWQDNRRPVSIQRSKAA
jgi:hypothetical protein